MEGAELIGAAASVATGGLSTLLGGAIGGVLRLAPEVLKLIDRKNERKHELALLDKNLQADKLKGEQALSLAQAQGQITLDASGLEALKEAIKGQGQLTGVWWIDALSQLMRPIITLQWVVFLYPASLIATWVVLCQGGISKANALMQVFGADEKAICFGIINFWFLDRVIKKRS